MALPSPTVSAKSAGYIPRGKRRWIWCTAVASVAAPTTAELSAGTDITPMVSAYAGWTGSSDLVDYGNASTRWTGKIPGPISADDSSVTLNLDKGGADARSMFLDGVDGSAPTSGFMAICYEGITSTGKMRVFPATVSSVKPSEDLDAPATIEVDFGITDQPSLFIAIPTV